MALRSGSASSCPVSAQWHVYRLCVIAIARQTKSSVSPLPYMFIMHNDGKTTVHGQLWVQHDVARIKSYRSFDFACAPLRMTGAPPRVTGAPLTMTGAPLSMTGAPLTMTGAPLTMMDAPLTMTGAPLTTTGAPLRMTGAPLTMTVVLPGMTGVLFWMTGVWRRCHPERSEGSVHFSTNLH